MKKQSKKSYKKWIQQKIPECQSPKIVKKNGHKINGKLIRLTLKTVHHQKQSTSICKMTTEIIIIQCINMKISKIQKNDNNFKNNNNSNNHIQQNKY